MNVARANFLPPQTCSLLPNPYLVTVDMSSWRQNFTNTLVAYVARNWMPSRRPKPSLCGLPYRCRESCAHMKHLPLAHDPEGWRDELDGSSTCSAVHCDHDDSPAKRECTVRLGTKSIVRQQCLALVDSVGARSGAAQPPRGEAPVLMARTSHQALAKKNIGLINKIKEELSNYPAS